MAWLTTPGCAERIWPCRGSGGPWDKRTVTPVPDCLLAKVARPPGKRGDTAFIHASVKPPTPMFPSHLAILHIYRPTYCGNG